MSSANILHPEDKLDVTSFTYTRKRTGPNTEPCGTLFVTKLTSSKYPIECLDFAPNVILFDADSIKSV